MKPHETGTDNPIDFPNQMNANELADKIEDARNETDFQRWAAQAPDMLRQLQAEIEALKAEIVTIMQRAVEMNVVKDLSDEEVWETWQEAKHTALNTRGSDFVEVIFARAILRKAGEK